MTVIVNSIIQTNIPVAQVNKSVKISFDFNTNGGSEKKGARIEVRVISDSIITGMYAPMGSEFETSADRTIATVTSVADKSNGWGVNRHITLQFDVLPAGDGDYIVGTLYYYNTDNVLDKGIPLLVRLAEE
ncbi:hypothetical protein [Klebsiella sp. BIGb0407]|uniref:hypothetical protein n=1 Tax=Klebsiella sp. BIGb0407 TaxID=2940603 RepID=UPI0021677DD6|nr:hypothetical protein [Klebsiella sp. BIGb0407]MCS3429689.1 hypothetical protein [Klebsiella sp. BIGb0407]